MKDSIREIEKALEETSVDFNMEELEEVVTIAGKCCESGDIIIKDIELPKANRGDIIAVMTTGAYCYSMASNYNRNTLPPVVFVRDGKSGIAVKGQTYDDIVRNDIVDVKMA